MWFKLYFLHEAIENKLLKEGDLTKPLSYHFNRNDTTLTEDIQFMNRYLNEGLSDEMNSYMKDKLTSANLKANMNLAKKKVGIVNSILKKAISLNLDDVEQTTNLRYKALRLGIATFIIVGSAALPFGLITTLIKATAAIGTAKYSSARLEKNRIFFESQIEYLEDKIQEEYDSKKKNDLVKIKKEYELSLNKTNKLIDMKDVLKEKGKEAAVASAKFAGRTAVSGTKAVANKITRRKGSDY